MMRKPSKRLRLRECAALLLVELWIIATHTRYYVRAQKRALKARRVAFFALPRTHNEKFFWRKVFDHNPEFTRLSDKLELRNWLAEQDVGLTMMPLMWVGDRASDIPVELLVPDYVLKANHATAQHMFFEDDSIDAAEVREVADGWLKFDLFPSFGEWGYKNVVPRLFIEERLGSPGEPVTSWKIFTFGRHVERVIQFVEFADARGGQVFEQDQTGQIHRIHRDEVGACDFAIDEPLPEQFPTILAMARDLGAPFDHVRVDFLMVGSTVVMSEMTLYNQGGYSNYGGEELGSIMTRSWDIRRTWFLRTRPGGRVMKCYAAMLSAILDRWDDGAELPPA